VVKMLTGEIDVNAEKISRPGLLSEFMGIKVDLGHTSTADKPIIGDTSDSAGTARLCNSSSSSGDITTSYATMTFNSIYDRSN